MKAEEHTILKDSEKPMYGSVPPYLSAWRKKRECRISSHRRCRVRSLTPQNFCCSGIRSLSALSPSNRLRKRWQYGIDPEKKAKLFQTLRCRTESGSAEFYLAFSLPIAVYKLPLRSSFTRDKKGGKVGWVGTLFYCRRMFLSRKYLCPLPLLFPSAIRSGNKDGRKERGVSEAKY